MDIKKVIFFLMCIVINIVLGMVIFMINILLLFLDIVGIVFGVVVLGFFWGVFIGGCINLVLGVILGFINIFFVFVNIVFGFIVGYIFKKKGFGYKEVIIIGVILFIVCFLIGIFILVLLFGGLSGSGVDLLVGFLV